MAVWLVMLRRVRTSEPDLVDLPARPSSSISIRELRNHGGDVVGRAAKGERLTITRSGKAVAELRPLGREPVPLDVVISRRLHLPPVDPAKLRLDLDQVLDPSL